MKQTSQHKAIVLAAFGTVRQNARQGFDVVEQRVRALYPEWEVVWAFTSEKVRRGITRSGQQADSIDSALDRLKAKGMTRLAVQSLHTAPGSEFENMRDTCMERLQAGEFEALHVGGPLLDSPEDLELAAQGLRTYLPPCRAGETAVLVGHGAIHEGHACYAALQKVVHKIDPDILIGTLTGEPGIDKILQILLTRAPQNVHLLPFLSVPGYHVREDIAGNGSASWASRIQKAGMQCHVRQTGIIEHPPFVDIWLAHLADAVQAVES